MAKVEVLDFVQILFDPEPAIAVSEKERNRRGGPTIRVLLSALRTAGVGVIALITWLRQVKPDSPKRTKRTYMGSFCFFERRVDAPLSPRFVIAVDAIAGGGGGGCVEHFGGGQRERAASRVRCDASSMPEPPARILHIPHRSHMFQ